jgi:hypothetical protein
MALSSPTVDGSPGKNTRWAMEGTSGKEDP